MQLYVGGMFGGRELRIAVVLSDMESMSPIWCSQIVAYQVVQTRALIVEYAERHVLSYMEKDTEGVGCHRCDVDAAGVSW